MTDNSDQRSKFLWLWFVELCKTHELGVPQGNIQAVSGDASFRRYFRGSTNKGNWILVDAPVEKENSQPFLEVQAILANASVQVPAILASDLTQGFMCLEDFGDDMLLSKLKSVSLDTQKLDAAHGLYSMAFKELLKIQSCDVSSLPLPGYENTKLLSEMLLFSDWLCRDFLKIDLQTDEIKLLAQVHTLLIDSAQAQTKVLVHRDYHSRNLMLPELGIGVIDFQDAVIGPFTYDLVSLLKDCYIKWPAADINSWALEYLHLAIKQGVVRDLGEEQFLQDFHLMGVQRHLKAAGIFCRLYLRDSKPAYLHDIPRTLAYIYEGQYEQSELTTFAQWIKSKVMPRLNAKLLSIEQEVPSPIAIKENA